MGKVCSLVHVGVWEPGSMWKITLKSKTVLDGIVLFLRVTWDCIAHVKLQQKSKVKLPFGGNLAEKIYLQ